MIFEKVTAVARKKKDERHQRNPFRHEVVAHTIKGTRAIYASPTKENNFAMISRETGEYFGNIAFGRRITVDKTNFLKFYAAGVKMFLDLGNPGIKVFMLIYDLLMENKNYQADKIELVYELMSVDAQKQISRSTFYRGIKELIRANFLAPSFIDGTYWINCDYVFRGDRLTLVNEYVSQDYFDSIEKTKKLQLAEAKKKQAIAAKKQEMQDQTPEQPTLTKPQADE